METARLAMTAHATGDERNPPRDQPLSAAAAVEQDLNPLQHLIHQRLRERGWSYGEVARRGGVPHSTVYTLATTRNLARPPRPATIDALAKGLDVPVSAVRAAAAGRGSSAAGFCSSPVACVVMATNLARLPLSKPCRNSPRSVGTRRH